MSLPEFPTDRIHQILDDTAARAVMLQLGVLEQLESKPGLAWNTCVQIVDHPTHWCFCARIAGNPDPAENGLMVTTYPKVLVPLAQVRALAAAYLGDATVLTIHVLRGTGRN